MIFGLFHGLVYLPVLLSMIGPAPYLSADRRYVHDKASKSKDEEKGADNLAMEKQVNRNKIQADILRPFIINKSRIMPRICC